MTFDNEDHKQMMLAILNSDLAVPVKMAEPLAGLKQAVVNATVAEVTNDAAPTPKTGKRTR